MLLFLVDQIGGRDVPSANGAHYGQGVYTATTAGCACKFGPGGVILSRALQGAVGASHTDTAANSWTGSGNIAVFRESEQLLPVCVVHFTANTQQQKK